MYMTDTELAIWRHHFLSLKRVIGSMPVVDYQRHLAFFNVVFYDDMIDEGGGSKC